MITVEVRFRDDMMQHRFSAHDEFGRYVCDYTPRIMYVTHIKVWAYDWEAVQRGDKRDVVFELDVASKMRSWVIGEIEKDMPWLHKYDFPPCSTDEDEISELCGNCDFTGKNTIREFLQYSGIDPDLFIDGEREFTLREFKSKLKHIPNGRFFD